MPGLATNQMAIRGELAQGNCLTAEQLDNKLPDINRDQIVQSVGRMISHGLAERVERGCYQLTKTGERSALEGDVMRCGPKGPDTAAARKPIPDTLRQRAWNVMRLPGIFTVPDLVAVAIINGENSPTVNLQIYCKGLEKAGYLLELADRVEGTKPRSRGFVRYRLIKDTGEIAPVLRRTKRTIYDHNLRKEVPFK